MNKTLFALALLLAAMSAQAHERCYNGPNYSPDYTECPSPWRRYGATVHDIGGTWYNPEYDGEGFQIVQYDHWNFVITLYTYDTYGAPFWVIGTGELGNPQGYDASFFPDNGASSTNFANGLLYAAPEGARYWRFGMGTPYDEDKTGSVMFGQFHLYPESCDQLRVRVEGRMYGEPFMSLEYTLIRLTPRREMGLDHCDDGGE